MKVKRLSIGILIGWSLVAATGCGDKEADTMVDSGSSDGAMVLLDGNAPPPDASPDAAEAFDAAVPYDAAELFDAGGLPDAGVDGGQPDAGPPDAGPPDAGPPDAGPPDAGPPDAGPECSGAGDCAYLTTVPDCNGDLLEQQAGVCVMGTCRSRTRQIADCTVGSSPPMCRMDNLVTVTGFCAPGTAGAAASCDMRTSRRNCATASSCAGLDFTAAGACVSGSPDDCVAVTTPCTVPDDECASGRLVSHSATCDDAAGCGDDLVRSRCPAAAATCMGNTVHVTYAPACASATSCDPDGAPTRSSCVAQADQCTNGRLVTYSPTCDPVTGCGETSNIATCPAADPICVSSALYRQYVPLCADGASCDPDGAPADTRCVAPIAECQRDVHVRYAPTCDPSTGCGVSETRTDCGAMTGRFCDAMGYYFDRTCQCSTSSRTGCSCFSTGSQPCPSPPSQCTPDGRSVMSWETASCQTPANDCLPDGDPFIYSCAYGCADGMCIIG